MEVSEEGTGEMERDSLLVTAVIGKGVMCTN